MEFIGRGVHLGVTALPFPGPEFWGFPPKLHVCPLHATPLMGVRMRKGGAEAAGLHLCQKSTLSKQWSKGMDHGRHQSAKG